MINEEIFDSELDSVAGGTIMQTSTAFDDLGKMGLIAKGQEFSCSVVRETFDRFGIKLEDHGGIFKSNKYFIKATGMEIGYRDALNYIRFQIG